MKFKNQIRAERESVCMADDCNSPNTSYLNYADDEGLSQFMDSVAKYVPSMRGVVWSVICNGKAIAYLIYDAKGNYRYELAIPDRKVSELAEKKIYCRYYHFRRFYDFRSQPAVELYPECETLIEKVKAHEMYLEKK